MYEFIKFDSNLNEDKLFFNSESSLRVGRVARHQFQQSFSLVEPLAECSQLSIKLYFMVSHRVDMGPLGIASRRAGDGEWDRLHAAATHRDSLWTRRGRRHDQLDAWVCDLWQTSVNTNDLIIQAQYVI